MFSKLISVRAVSLGGYLGNKNIQLELTNHTAKQLTVDIDPALIFKPDDTSYQDLVLVGNESLALGPCSSGTIKLEAFCGKSYAHAPIPNLNFIFRKQGDSNMVKMLVYAKTNKVPVSIVQRAVWTFTNNYCLNTVYGHRYSREGEEMVKYIAGLKKLKIPSYYSESKLEDASGRSVIVTGKEKKYATMHWGNEGYRHMYLTILRENGSIYKRIEADQVIDKYGHTVIVEFNPRVDPAGIYTVQLHDEYNKVWDQKQVVLGVVDCDVPR